MLTQEPSYPKPFLKWAGGKNKLIQQYISCFPQEFANYYEPFLGGGAVFFYLYNNYLLNSTFLSDINPELINTYLCIKHDVEAVISLLQQHQKNHNQEYYYYMRSYNTENSVKRAARLIYLNKTCFNGLYRENSKGEFNVPMGKYKNLQICNSELLRAVAQALQVTQIEVKPFEAVLNYAKSPEDFVYFDPPYYPLSNTSNFTAYSRDAFNKDDQIKLKDVCVELAHRGVKVMQSNSDCLFIRELYRDFKIYEIKAARAINSNATKRGKISEVLITI
ncbi:DNA adenine methylase [Gloeocapsopsis dulcis]|uniref:Site-specific DNA-methyltransferase (adenine-specific) n=1 Tax=Gloeocapsopsis dulcis AAB1 = 1H9 TaxID=1433147 RepID=A0A6N8FUL2_9CHRO|nr:DNA adenine methylase [Gloeocapsopsis dulcis]MUL36464.1 DNA methyltransferase [Gloeocapsopsis dulcis AAB1 = 1H9]WNN87753.1 DNA adenine methylase [Gloeocapsopsis dulcis]